MASDLWEKLTARCVDRHRSDLCPVIIESKFNTSAALCLLTLYIPVVVDESQLRVSGISEIQFENSKENTDVLKFIHILN